MKVLPINVYRNGSSDCTNGGISSKFSQLLLVCPEGYITVDEENLPENVVKLVKRKMFGEVINSIEPYKAPTEIGWMFGGNYAASSDYRFTELTGIYGAIAIHDRQESQELYDMLSR